MPRKNESFIEAYCAYLDRTSSPPLFRKWGAIATIAGALERRVWVTTMGRPMYPNMYTILVGPPAVGKTNVTRLTRELWGSLRDHHLAASSMTAASIVDELRDSTRRIINPGQLQTEFNSLKICSNELQVLFSEYNLDFIGKVTDIYDNIAYSERRRGGDGKFTFNIDNPQLNIFGATTPGHMQSSFPEAAWSHGFFSRCVLVFSAESRKASLFTSTAGDSKAHKALINDIGLIGRDGLFGEMTFTDEAAELIDAWWLSDGEPAPTHPKLLNYLPRRTGHLLKLMMVASIDEGESLIINADHFNRALEWLIEAEAYMPEIFKSMSTISGGAQVTENLHYVLYQAYQSNKKPISKAAVIQFLIRTNIPHHLIEPTLNTMVEAKMLQLVAIPDGGGLGYIPLMARPGL